MGRRTTNAKKFIVSCRVSSEEMDILQDIARTTDTNISNLLRKSLLTLQHSEEQNALSA